MKDGDVKEELPEETAPAAVAVEVAVADGVKQEQPETSEQAADEAADGDQDGGDDDRQAGQAQRQSTRRKPHVDLGKLDVRRTCRCSRRCWALRLRCSVTDKTLCRLPADPNRAQVSPAVQDWRPTAAR